MTSVCIREESPQKYIFSAVWLTEDSPLKPLELIDTKYLRFFKKFC